MFREQKDSTAKKKNLKKYSNKIAEVSRGQMVESFELPYLGICTLAYGQWFPIWALGKSFWQFGGERAGAV